MRETEADVVVVGCGPVGAIFAGRTADEGLRVVALEQSRAEEQGRRIEVFHMETAAFERLGIGAPPAEEVITVYSGMTVHAPDARLAVRVEGVETYALDLPRFLIRMQEDARMSGAEILFETRATRIERGGGAARVIAEGPKGEFAVRARVVVDATGLAGLTRQGPPPAALSVYMELWTDTNGRFPEGIHSYLGPNAWTAWYPEYGIVGIGVPGPPAEAERRHAEFAARQAAIPHRVRRTVHGRIPFDYPPPALVDDNLVLIGDRAAMNKPFSGEGIASGGVAARLAVPVVVDAVRRGSATRADLWPAAVRFFRDQGAKFALLRAMAEELITLPDEDVNFLYANGITTAEDLRNTFLHYQVSKSAGEAASILVRLARRPRLLARLARAGLRAARIQSLAKAYPENPAGFSAWEATWRRRIGR